MNLMPRIVKLFACGGILLALASIVDTLYLRGGRVQHEDHAPSLQVQFSDRLQEMPRKVHPTYDAIEFHNGPVIAGESIHFLNLCTCESALHNKHRWLQHFCQEHSN